MWNVVPVKRIKEKFTVRNSLPTIKEYIEFISSQDLSPDIFWRFRKRW